MTYTDYHSLIYFQKAKQLAKEVIFLADKLPKSQAVQIVYKQLIRSASSIGANIVEGYGRNNQKEYRQFLGIARGSSLETEYWLELLYDTTSFKPNGLVDLNREVI